MPIPLAFINLNKEKCTEFEQVLIDLTLGYKLKRDILTRESNELLWRWYGHCNENYACQSRLISDYLQGDTINEATLDELQYRRQIGERIFPTLLYAITSAEQILTDLKSQTEELDNLVKRSVLPLVASLEEKWMEEDISIRNSVLNSVHQGKVSFGRLRRVLKELEYITDTEEKFMASLWDIRNASHNNYISLGNISISFTNTDGVRREYRVIAGQPMHTPNWFVTDITEELSRIMVRILSH